jgi:hypothetical protein
MLFTLAGSEAAEQNASVYYTPNCGRVGTAPCLSADQWYYMVAKDD